MAQTILTTEDYRVLRLWRGLYEIRVWHALTPPGGARRDLVNWFKGNKRAALRHAEALASGTFAAR